MHHSTRVVLCLFSRSNLINLKAPDGDFLAVSSKSWISFISYINQPSKWGPFSVFLVCIHSLRLCSDAPAWAHTLWAWSGFAYASFSFNGMFETGGYTAQGRRDCSFMAWSRMDLRIYCKNQMRLTLNARNICGKMYFMTFDVPWSRKISSNTSLNYINLWYTCVTLWILSFIFTKNMLQRSFQLQLF